jgi:hypothetical protein
LITNQTIPSFCTKILTDRLVCDIIIPAVLDLRQQVPHWFAVYWVAVDPPAEENRISNYKFTVLFRLL